MKKYYTGSDSDMKSLLVFSSVSKDAEGNLQLYRTSSPSEMPGNGSIGEVLED